ncbi:Hypothetical_protein [Hexamita inflata]|uniref:Hypothetical_protein n=1 Tax=Hexamita inflata TaxID=28002 RepID=A0AA86VH64_9EUKA|nr:Hypothetical protein HINF_LOCUS54153 [Hexamita inflata]
MEAPVNYPEFTINRLNIYSCDAMTEFYRTNVEDTIWHIIPPNENQFVKVDVIEVILLMLVSEPTFITICYNSTRDYSVYATKYADTLPTQIYDGIKLTYFKEIQELDKTKAHNAIC